MHSMRILWSAATGCWLQFTVRRAMHVQDRHKLCVCVMHAFVDCILCCLRKFTAHRGLHYSLQASMRTFGPMGAKVNGEWAKHEISGRSVLNTKERVHKLEHMKYQCWINDLPKCEWIYGWKSFKLLLGRNIAQTAC